jgi:hypothetical protein
MARRRRRGSSGAAAVSLVDELPATASEVQRTAARLRQRQARERKIAAIERGQPTPEQLARNSYERVRIKEPGVAQGRYALKNVTAAPIDRWLARGLIDDRQHRAAVRYREDWERAGFQRSLIGRYDDFGGGGSTTAAAPGGSNIAQMDAWRRWRDARAQLQASLAEVFDAIVLFELAAEAAAEQIDSFRSAGGAYAARFAPIYVKVCAKDLADFYKLPA